MLVELRRLTQGYLRACKFPQLVHPPNNQQTDAAIQTSPGACKERDQLSCVYDCTGRPLELTEVEQAECRRGGRGQDAAAARGTPGPREAEEAGRKTGRHARCGEFEEADPSKS
eukprot:756099-Hanusia_phi.AAC.1